jgi:hypothetical protein
MPVFINGLQIQDPKAWDDLRAPATAINPPGLVSDPTFDSTNIGWLFDPSSTEILFIILQMPHSYSEGTNIIPHVHWESTDSNVGTVKWRLEYKWTNVGDIESGSYTAIDITPSTDGNSLKSLISGFGEISKTGARISSILSVKLSRIGGDDTYTGDALLKEFDIHYEKNTIGSLSSTSKFGA